MHEHDCEWFAAEGFKPPDNELCLNPSKRYDLNDLGFIVKLSGGADHTFSDLFCKWKKGAATAYILIQVPSPEVDGAKAKLKALGYKIV